MCSVPWQSAIASSSDHAPLGSSVMRVLGKRPFSAATVSISACPAMDRGAKIVGLCTSPGRIRAAERAIYFAENLVDRANLFTHNKVVWRE